MRHRILQGLAWAAVAALALNVACVDKPSDSTAGTTPLYVYDDTSKQVLVWNDVSTLYDLGAGATAPAADRTINIGALASGFQLAWGGMALDSANQRLYLVSADGTKVLRILYAGTQNGTPSSNTDYIIFSLGNAGPGGLSSGVFGQAAVNSNGDLLVTESDSTKSQIWLIPASSQVNGQNITTGVLSTASGDMACTGVAVNGTQAIYAYFNNGADISVNNAIYSGPRLRYGTFSGFSASSNVIIDVSNAQKVTELEQYGCLAFDYSTNGGILYTARQNTADPVLIHTPDLFTSGLNVPPSGHLTGPTNGHLRIIAHAGLKDWLVGAESTDTINTTGAGASTLWIWKAPSAGDSHLSVILPGSPKILGLALDGSQ